MVTVGPLGGVAWVPHLLHLFSISGKILKAFLPLPSGSTTDAEDRRSGQHGRLWPLLDTCELSAAFRLPFAAAIYIYIYINLFIHIPKTREYLKKCPDPPILKHLPLVVDWLMGCKLITLGQQSPCQDWWMLFWNFGNHHERLIN